MNYPAPPSCPLRLRALLLAGLVLLCAYTGAAAKPSFTVQPPPAWVQPVIPAQANSTTPPPQQAENGLRYLLVDRQVRVAAKSNEHYYQFLEQVVSTADLERVSQLRLDFEPSYQSLVIHHINLWRGGLPINVLRPAEIKVIQQEDELDEQLFNGTLSAVVFLNDVRAGDVIDYAYSVNGDNPVLAGRYADVFTMARPDPVAYLHTRLLWPAARKLYLRPRGTDAQPTVQQTGDEVEYLWEQRDVPAAVFEDATPGWFDALPRVQLSEHATWADVAQWAAPLYEVKALSPALSAQVEQWRKDLPTPEARLLAARRFVQDEVRYLGIELGPYSHTPTQPDKVFQRRFGDCKDKSLLLATLLNALGIEAHPALVNTRARHTLDDYQPSPYAFDHVIVQATLDGQTHWIDATMSYQRGTLANEATLEYERALVLRPDTNALTTMPLAQDAQPTTTIKESYRVDSFDAPVAFTVVSTFRAGDADMMRYRLASEPRADLGKDYLNYYADREPSIEAQGLPEVADDETANTIVVTEHYTIPQFWKDARHYFFAARIGAELDKPNVSRRTMPLRVSYPLHVEQLIEIQLPHRQEVSTGTETVEDEAMRLTAKASVADNVVRLRYTLNTKRDAVAPAQVAAHIARIEQARDLVSYELKQWPDIEPAGGTHALDALFGLALVGITGLVLYGWLKRRREARRVANVTAIYAHARATPGAQPETAIRLGAETEINNYLAGVTCRSCGQRTYGEAARHGLRYDDRRLVVVQLQCARCRNHQDLYFAPAV